MDVNRIIETLTATLDHIQQKQAELYLSEMHKIIGFAPALLEIVMSSEIAIPVRQAGIIYLKNLITNCWKEQEQEKPEDPLPFSIHEQDKQHLRERLVEAIIESPETIRVQLKTAMSTIVKNDFPSRWENLPQKLHQFLISPTPEHWIGALVSLYTLVKVYEYKKSDERDPLTMSMTHLLPVIQDRLTQLIHDNSEYSVLVQKQILKIFFATIKFYLPQDLVNKQVVTQWVEAIRIIIDRPVPESSLQVDEEERHELIWWKCKKWGMHILMCLFDRYGCPGSVLKQYTSFADWYLKSFSAPVISTLLKQCELYRQKQYVSNRVILITLNYFETALSHALAWKYLKPHFILLVQELIFPVLCHSDKDNEMWESDPQEYVRVKYDIFEDMLSPRSSAVSLLSEASVKRKGILEKTMGFCMHIITNESSDPRQKDGAFHMIGAVASILLKRKIYKDQMETFLTNYVLPVFTAPEGFRRARACWLTGRLANTKFRQTEVLRRSTEAARVALCSDSELPVRFEAATCLMDLLTNQEESLPVVKPHLAQIVMQILNLIRETESDDMNTVLQKIVCVFEEEIVPVAEEMTQHLADTFRIVMNSSENGAGMDERSVLAMGILNTIETILQVMEDHKEIMGKLESTVVQIVGTVLQSNVAEFYEEALSLTFSLTCQHISPVMWEVFYLIRDAFDKDAFEYFSDMMPALHNYITVDKVAFLNGGKEIKNIEIIFNMCKKVLQGEDTDEDFQCNAAKLLEVILIDYKGEIDDMVPRFVETALERLTRQNVCSELRVMCLQVVIAAIYYNPAFMLNILTQHPWPGTESPIMNNFFAQWLNDSDCFLGLHDRKVSVLGLCILLNLPVENRPTVVTNMTAEIMPSLMILFAGLKRAYASVAQDEEDGKDKDDEEGNGDVDYKELDSDEDDIDEESSEYLEMLEKADEEDDDDEDDDSLLDGETAMESYETVLDKEENTVDEYVIFMSTLETLKTNDPTWYQALMAPLNDDQQKTLKDTMEMALLRQQQNQSKLIEQAGGYSFQQTSVPSTFNFGGNFPGANQSR